MSFATLYMLVEVFIPLIVPLVIVATRKQVNGPLIACATIAIVCIAGLWLLSGQQGSLLVFAGPQNNALALRFVLYAVAGIIGDAAWVLAVYQATLARHWRWIGGLAASQVIAGAALLFSINPCILAAVTGGFGDRSCTPLAPSIVHLISAAWIASPAVALAYAVLSKLPRRRSTARGLAVSPLATQAGDAGNANPDGELEVRSERL